MKGRRQAEILRIIETVNIDTQDQLISELRSRGISSTQATISRDIKELHLVKELMEDGGYKYVVSMQSGVQNLSGKLRTIFKEGVTSFDLAQNMIVIKTMPGLAPAAASALDNMKIPDMVGSLAGDDTVLLIMRTNESAFEFCTEIHNMMK